MGTSKGLYPLFSPNALSLKELGIVSLEYRMDAVTQDIGHSLARLAIQQTNTKFI